MTLQKSSPLGELRLGRRTHDYGDSITQYTRWCDTSPPEFSYFDAQ